MILTERIITVNGNISTLDAPIYLYQGDKNVDIYFSIVNPKYKFSKKVVDNLLGETAAYFDLYIIKPDGSQVSFKNQAIEDKKAKWTIESELIDEEIEIGKYDFQIRLLDENKTSILTIPPLLGQLEILKPIYTDSDTPSNNLVNLAATNYALATSGNNDVVVFDEDGNYVATVWTDKMKITDTLLNKIETAIKQNTAQYKDIANYSLIKHTDGKVYIKKQDGTLIGDGIEIGGSDVDLSKITMSMSGQTLKLMNDGNQIATVEIPTATVTDEQLTSIIQSKIDDGTLSALTIDDNSISYSKLQKDALKESIGLEEISKELLTYKNGYIEMLDTSECYTYHEITSSGYNEATTCVLTPLIKVKPNKTYYRNPDSISLYWRIAYFDKDKNRIGFNGMQYTTKNIVTPNNCFYIQYEVQNLNSEYLRYYIGEYDINSEEVNAILTHMIKINFDNILNYKVTDVLSTFTSDAQSNTLTKEYNKDNISWIEGYEINGSGNIIELTGASVTDYIPVTEGSIVKRYIKADYIGVTRVAFFDSDKNLLKVVETATGVYEPSYIAPKNCCYIRVLCTNNTRRDYEQIKIYDNEYYSLPNNVRVTEENLIEILNNIKQDTAKSLGLKNENGFISIEVGGESQIEINSENNTIFEPLADDIPKVYIIGDISGMTKQISKDLILRYKSKTKQFTSFINMKWQGNSSLNYQKKNFTIKLFKDSLHNRKDKKNFRHWGSYNKYVLKANAADTSQSKNIIGARLWGEVVNSRCSVTTQMESSSNYCAVDGFPILLYINDECKGLYTWNIPKDNFFMKMTEENKNHAILCAEVNSNLGTQTTNANALACEFRTNANIDGNDWSLEFPDTLQDSIKTSFNDLINCVKDTDDETFKSTIGNYLDLESAIDYYLFMYFTAGRDNLAKNMLMYTYDGIKWYCGAYDMDWSFTLNVACPSGYQDNNSLLWERIENNFKSELYNRYIELRQTVLSNINVSDLFTDFITPITGFFSYDSIYSDITPANDSTLNTILNFVDTRATYTDEKIAEWKE